MKLSGKLFSIMAVLAMIFSAVMTTPAYAKGPDNAAVEKMATQVSKMVILNGDSTIGLRTDMLKRFSKEQQAFVTQFVDDLNAGKIGFFVQTDTGPIAYGSVPAEDLEAARQEFQLQTEQVQPDRSAPTPNNNAWNVNSSGLHVYLDAYWTSWLNDGANWAVATVAGIIAGALCSTGLGCIAVGVVVGFVFFVVGHIAMPYAPTTLALHVGRPYWSWGHLYSETYAQPFKPGAWYNGRMFYMYRVHLI